MAHILLGMNLFDDRHLGDQLRSWGVTTGGWTCTGDQVCLPGIWECDALLINPVEARQLPRQEPRAGRGPCAPILVWDGILVSAPDRAPRSAVVPISAGGGLFASLQVCVTHAEGLRDVKGDVPILETNPHHVVGHELLTPLTAIKTALEVLAGDLGDLEPGGSDADPRLRMAKLALRNVNRLRDAFDWSQGLLDQIQTEDIMAPQDEASGSGRMEDLAAGLARLAILAPGTIPDVPAPETGPVLDVAGKMIQSLQDALPGRPVRLHLLEDNGGCGIVILATPTDGETPLSSLGAADPLQAMPSWDPWRLALEKAASLRIPAHLVVASGGKLEIQSRGGFPCLALVLPAGTVDAQAFDGGLALRDSITVP